MNTCRHCRLSVQPTATTCPHCHKSLRPWYRHPAAIVVGALFGLGAIANAVHLRRAPPANFARAESVTTTTKPPSGHLAAAAPVELDAPIPRSCAQVAELFGAGSRLSSVQKQLAWKQFQGRPFAWNLSVVDVQQGMLGGFTVHYLCEGSTALVADIQLDYDSDARDYVTALDKGRSYRVRGRLLRYSAMAGLSGAAIVSPE